MLETDSLTIHNDWTLINHWVFLRCVSSRFSTGDCSIGKLKSCDTDCRLLLCVKPIWCDSTQVYTIWNSNGSKVAVLGVCVCVCVCAGLSSAMALL